MDNNVVVKTRRRGVVWVALSALSYSLFTIFGKTVLEQLRPTDVLFWRFVVAAPISWGLVWARNRRGHGARLRKVEWKPRFLMGVLFGILALLAFAGLRLMSGSLYVVIIYTYPAMVALGSWAMGKPTPRHVWSAIVVIAVGIVLTVPEVLHGAGDSALAGMILTLGNAMLYATYILYSERIVGSSSATGESQDSFVAAAWGMLGSLSFAVVVVLFTRGVRWPHGLGHVGAMIGLGTVSTVVAMTAFFLGVAQLGPARAAVIASLEPVLALVWLVVISHETLAPVQLVGAMFVVAGVIWANRPSDAGTVDVVGENPREDPVLG